MSKGLKLRIKENTRISLSKKKHCAARENSKKKKFLVIVLN